MCVCVKGIAMVVYKGAYIILFHIVQCVYFNFHAEFLISLNCANQLLSCKFCNL